MQHRILLSSLFTMVTLACGTPALADAKYAVTSLGFYATALNNQNQIVGYNYNAGDYTSFLWSNNVAQSMAHSYATDINGHGQIVGQFTGSDGLKHAGIVENGQLSTLGAAGSIATGINDAGHIVGQDGNNAALWVNGSVTHIPNPTAIHYGPSGYGDVYETEQLYATSINNHDQIGLYGKSLENPYYPSPDPFFSNYKARTEDHGTQQVLPFFASNPYADSQVYGLNDHGQAVGAIDDNVQNGFFGAFAVPTLWSNGTAIDLSQWDNQHLTHYSNAVAINDAGDIVGDTFQPFSDGRAALWTHGRYIDLNTLIDPSLGITLVRATDINQQGNIIALGMDADGTYTSFLLAAPVPEPEELGLMLVGLVMLAGVAKRRQAV